MASEDAPSPAALPQPSPPQSTLRAHPASSGRRGKAAKRDRKALPSSAGPEVSRQEDPFNLYYGQGGLIPPPFLYQVLVDLHDASDILGSAVDAMATNLSFGIQLVPRDGQIPKGREAEAERELARLKAWFEAAFRPGWRALQKRTRIDYELFGDAYWEVLRNARGEVVGLEPARAFWMRKTIANTDPVEVDEPVRAEDGSWTTRKAFRRYRRFVQFVNGKLVWFKEFGDPRVLRAASGAFAQEGEEIPPTERATEILNFMQYNPASVYGKPRWRGAARGVKGRAAAGDINGDVFDNRGVPPLLILVSGTTLAPGTVEKIQEHFRTMAGRENWHQPLILEAAAADVGPAGDLGPTAPVRLAVEDLSRAQQNDALFLKYSGQASEDVRMTFRLPPLFLGMSSDYTRATAEAAKVVGEEQVFEPARAEEDDILNTQLLPALGARFYQVKGRGAPLVNEDTLLKMLELGLKASLFSPNEVAAVLEPMLGRTVSRKEDWARLPTSILDALLKAGLVPKEVLEMGFAAAAGGSANTAPPAPQEAAPPSSPAAEGEVPAESLRGPAEGAGDEPPG